MDCAIGWFERASVRAAMVSSVSSVTPVVGWRERTVNLPSVSVPVLSNTAVVVLASRYMYTPPLTSTPLRDAAPIEQK